MGRSTSGISQSPSAIVEDSSYMGSGLTQVRDTWNTGIRVLGLTDLVYTSRVLRESQGMPWATRVLLFLRDCPFGYLG